LRPECHSHSMPPHPALSLRLFFLSRVGLAVAGGASRENGVRAARDGRMCDAHAVCMCYCPCWVYV
jgi:hypothetical protein